MFNGDSVKKLGGRFKYSVVIYGEAIVYNQPLSSTSLKEAIKEAVNFEASLQPTLGLSALKMFEIKPMKKE
jgi:hypothetical protein